MAMPVAVIEVLQQAGCVALRRSTVKSLEPGPILGRSRPFNRLSHPGPESSLQPSRGGALLQETVDICRWFHTFLTRRPQASALRELEIGGRG
jgi:hypothetical protein